MADISSITLPGGGTYDLKDKNAVPKYGMGKNLLRNWYFGNPVNQRGITSRAAAYSSQYFIDGWSTNRASFSIVSNGITFNAITAGWGFFQAIHSLVNGEKYTISVLSSGNLYSTTFIASSSNIGIDLNETFRVEITYYSNVWFNLKERNVDSTITAVKLELGTEQTLCHNEGTAAAPVWVLNEIPDYEYELYRCITSTADPSDTYANKSLATEQQLAYVETGTTASRNYTAGEYICWNGLLYTANQAIGSGATLSADTGGNLTECVCGGFNLLSTVTNGNVSFSNNVTGYTYQNEYHLSKSGNVVTTHINMSTGNIAGMGTLLCTVPAAFRPSANRRIAAWLTYNGESRVDTVFISPSGEITTASGGYSVSGFIRVFGTYML